MEIYLQKVLAVWQIPNTTAVVAMKGDKQNGSDCNVSQNGSQQDVVLDL